MAELIRVLQKGDTGKDVEAVKRAVHRYLRNGGLAAMAVQSSSVKQTFGPFFEASVKKAQKKAGLVVDGRVGKKMEVVLRNAGAFDAKANQLLVEYARESKKVVLVEPKQGFSSLRKDLWEAYSIGRHMGLSDLGTYNPQSTLPSGGPSDHSVFPAAAFDLGIEPDTGWNNLVARKFFNSMVGRPEVEYVILGDRIWSVGRGLRTYTAGGHLNHVHVSGLR